MARRTPSRQHAHEPAAQPPLLEMLTPDLALRLQPTVCLQSGHTGLQQLDVLESASFGRLFRLDGCVMTTEADEWVYHENLCHPAAIALPHPQRALIVGGGDGGSARQLLKHPTLREIVLCEIDAAVIAMARDYLFTVHQGALDDPHVQIVIADGAEYVTTASAPFDLIVLDLTDPQGLAAALYSADFFTACARLLGQHGCLCLHLASPMLHPERITALLVELGKEFAIVRPYQIPVTLYGGSWTLACASQQTDIAALTAEQVELQLAMRGIDNLQYYNGGTHVGALALPNYLQRLCHAALTAGKRATPAS